MTFENLNLAFISLLITLSILFFAYYRGRYNKVFSSNSFNPKFRENLFSFPFGLYLYL